MGLFGSKKTESINIVIEEQEKYQNMMDLSEDNVYLAFLSLAMMFSRKFMEKLILYQPEISTKITNKTAGQLVALLTVALYVFFDNYDAKGMVCTLDESDAVTHFIHTNLSADEIIGEYLILSQLAFKSGTPVLKYMELLQTSIFETILGYSNSKGSDTKKLTKSINKIFNSSIRCLAPKQLDAVFHRL